MSKLFAIVTRDKPDSQPIRMANLKEHLAHIEASLDRLALAGPLRDADGNFTGSLLVLKADSEAEARALLETDPYFSAGVWSDIAINELNAAAGEWVGGKNW